MFMFSSHIAKVNFFIIQDCSIAQIRLLRENDIL